MQTRDILTPFLRPIIMYALQVLVKTEIKVWQNAEFNCNLNIIICLII